MLELFTNFVAIHDDGTVNKWPFVWELGVNGSMYGGDAHVTDDERTEAIKEALNKCQEKFVTNVQLILKLVESGAYKYAEEDK